MEKAEARVGWVWLKRVSLVAGVITAVLEIVTKLSEF